LLVLQGGSDTYCFIPKIIRALSSLKDDFKITVVLGPSFKCWKRLNQVLKYNMKPIKLLRNIENMPTVMSNHDLAITAAGNTLLELASMGIPPLVICGEQFETETAKLMEKKGFGINLGYGGDISINKIASATSHLMSSYNTRKKMRRAGKKIVDGKGPSRVVNLIKSIFPNLESY